MSMSKPRAHASHEPDPDAPQLYARSASKSIQKTLPSSTQQPARPFSSYVTLDLIIYILSRSIFHPAITLIAYLCLAALHKHREPISFYTLYWSAFLCGLEILGYLNRRITFGPPREVDWEHEVVVITGGGSGLGRVLMESLVMRGVKVAVLDVNGIDAEAEELAEGATGELCWERCDVGRLEEVEGAVERVVKELGPPTILINNAATRINALPLLPPQPSSPTIEATSTTDKSPLTTLTPAQALQTLQTNTLSHFNLLHALLPHLLESPTGGHIITISSILRHISPSHLSDYVASKAAVSALHSSLQHEIASHPDPHVRRNIKTLLVEVGQMDTELFKMTKLTGRLARWAGPVVETKDVVRWITWYLERGEGGVLRLPFYAGVVGWGWGLMPGAVERVLRWGSGVDGAVRR